MHGVKRIEHQLDRAGDLLFCARPDLDDLVVALLVRDETTPVVTLDARHLGIGSIQDSRLLRRDFDVVDRDRNAGHRGVVEAEILDLIQHGRRDVVPVLADQPRHQVFQAALVHRLVLETDGLSVGCLEHLGNGLVEQDSTDAGLHALGRPTIPIGHANLDLRPEIDLPEIEGKPCIL